MRVDVALVGAGGAGLSLVLALDELRAAGADVPSLALIDPTHRAAADRTWCYWERPDDPVGGDAVAALAHRRWSRVDLRSRTGTTQLLDLDPLRYVMVRSEDFYAAADAAASRLGVVRVNAAAGGFLGAADDVTVSTEQGGVQASWVFDSRPGPPERPARTALLQHFRGWVVRFPRDVLDPDRPMFMDFTTPQPARGVSFGYCLPLASDLALVEYTEFSPAPLTPAAYDAALAAYLRERWDVGVGDSAGAGVGDVRIEHVEDGVIPMTDAVHARRIGPRAFRLGGAGGATRPATGYTFAAMQRQASAVAAALVAGTDPMPPRPYPLRHRWMDAVLLRALDQGLTPAPELFASLFERNPAERVLRFLDGDTTPAEEIAVMAGCPVLPMGRAAVTDSLVRARNRLLHR